MTLLNNLRYFKGHWVYRCVENFTAHLLTGAAAYTVNHDWDINKIVSDRFILTHPIFDDVLFNKVLGDVLSDKVVDDELFIITTLEDIPVIFFLIRYIFSLMYFLKASFYFLNLVKQQMNYYLIRCRFSFLI